MKIVGWLGVATCVAMVAGCGGGSGSGSTTSTTGTAGNTTTRAAVLVTDSPREDYSHIWATIYHVEIVPQSGTAVVLFDNPSGVQIDLKTLRDASGQRFSFLGGAAIPAGTYKALNITIGATMQLFKNGATVGDSTAVDASIPKDANGLPVITVNFKAPKTLGAGTTNLVVDFDLAHFIVRDAKVLPMVVEGAPTGLENTARHNDGDYRGTISNVTGTEPNLTFTLTDPQNPANTITVATNAATSLYGSGKLANGSKVSLQGVLDTTTQSIVASQIRLCETQSDGKPAPAPETPGIGGAVTNISATAGTFTITVADAHGVVPKQTSVNVITSGSTQYYADGGVSQTAADFFTSLTKTPNVVVVGTYDAASNTITATVAKVDTHPHDAPANPNPDFRPGVNKQNWDGGHM